MTERKFNHQSWFLYYPEEGNTRGAPTQLLRGVEFGIETKALLFKRLCFIPQENNNFDEKFT